MDLQKIATYVSAAAVIGTGSVVGGNVALDRASGGPEKRLEAQATELRQIVREEVRAALLESLPTNTGTVKGKINKPEQDYRQEVPRRK